MIKRILALTFVLIISLSCFVMPSASAMAMPADPGLLAWMLGSLTAAGVSADNPNSQQRMMNDFWGWLNEDEQLDVSNPTLFDNSYIVYDVMNGVYKYVVPVTAEWWTKFTTWVDETFNPGGNPLNEMQSTYFPVNQDYIWASKSLGIYHEKTYFTTKLSDERCLWARDDGSTYMAQFQGGNGMLGITRVMTKFDGTSTRWYFYKGVNEDQQWASGTIGEVTSIRGIGDVSLGNIYGDEDYIDVGGRDWQNRDTQNRDIVLPVEVGADGKPVADVLNQGRPVVPYADYAQDMIGAEPEDVINEDADGVPYDMSDGEVVTAPVTDIFSLLQKIYTDFLEWLRRIGEFLGGIYDFMNPNSPNFFLKLAFIPPDNYFQNRFEQFKDDMANWLGYDDYIHFLEDLKNVQAVDEDYTKTINIWGVGPVTARWFDASMYNQQKSWVYNIIRGIMFFGIVIFNINQIYRFLNRGATLAQGYGVATGQEKGGGKK